jgi:hypothetical protein
MSAINTRNSPHTCSDIPRTCGVARAPQDARHNAGADQPIVKLPAETAVSTESPTNSSTGPVGVTQAFASVSQ